MKQEIRQHDEALLFPIWFAYTTMSFNKYQVSAPTKKFSLQIITTHCFGIIYFYVLSKRSKVILKMRFWWPIQTRNDFFFLIDRILAIQYQVHPSFVYSNKGNNMIHAIDHTYHLLYVLFTNLTDCTLNCIENVKPIIRIILLKVNSIYLIRPLYMIILLSLKIELYI